MPVYEGRPLRILHLAPLWVPVSRDAPGGIETLLANLIPAMTPQGCESTILACGGSRIAGPVIEVVPLGVDVLMETGAAVEYAYYEQHQLRLALQSATDFDVIHSHIGAAAYMLSALPQIRDRVLHTAHRPVWGDLEWFVRLYPHHWYSTVSEHQARKLRLAGATRCHAIHNGIDLEAFTFEARPRDGLLFMGRMEAVKGPDIAVRVARTLGRPLVLAGPIVEREFFERRVAPFLSDDIRYIGVVDHRRKTDVLREAACAILPFREEEPFGLVAIEAMACGTPVVALANGALPEIVEPGVTGFLGTDENTLVDLVKRAVLLDRGTVRARVAARFDIATTAKRYCELYRCIVEGVN